MGGLPYDRVWYLCMVYTIIFVESTGVQAHEKRRHKTLTSYPDTVFLMALRSMRYKGRQAKPHEYLTVTAVDLEFPDNAAPHNLLH